LLGGEESFVYLAAVILLLLVLPLASAAVEATIFVVPDAVFLLGKWFTFWAVGARLFLAGVTQVFRPQFTAQSIFAIKDASALPIVREVGFGNLAMGTLGLATAFKPDWVLPAALAGGLYYGLAGIGHALRDERNAKEWVALISDFGIFLVLAAFVVLRAA
jgi:hypothetical protein